MIKIRIKITNNGVLWLKNADKIVDSDSNFAKEYDYIHAEISEKHGAV